MASCGWPDESHRLQPEEILMSTPVVLEDQVLKMHTARDGLVWYVDGGRDAVNTHAPIEDFLEDSACQRARHVRMVGSSGNARALCVMYCRKLRGLLLRLEVASPAVIGRTRAERADPRLMLVRIRDSAADGLNPAMGGWHEFDRDDYNAYTLAAFEASDYPSRAAHDIRQSELKRHPAWPALSFIWHLDREKLAQLLGIVLDPRWYVSLRAPRHGGDMIPYHDDAAKLHAYLGLDPRTMAGVLGFCTENSATARCRLVLETWSGTGVPAPAEQEQPACFLWRRYRREDGPVKGALRASQMFVDYLRLVWLDALYCDHVRGRPAAPGKRPFQEGLFAPDHFFSHAEEAAAYTQHRNTIAGQGA
jgi:hypothetical protein